MENINRLKNIIIQLNKINKNFHDLWIRSFEASPYSFKQIYEEDQKIILEQKDNLLKLYNSKQMMYDVLIYPKIKNIVNDFFDLKIRQPIDTYFLHSLMIILIPHLIEAEYKKQDNVNYRKKTANTIVGLSYKGFKKWDYVEKISEDHLIANKVRVQDEEDKFLIKKEKLREELDRFRILHNHYILVLWDKKDMRLVTRYNFFKYYIWVLLGLIVALIIIIVWYTVSRTSQ